MGYRSLAKNIVGTITMPVRWVATTVGNAFDGWGKYFAGIKALDEKNKELIDENAALKEQLQNAELLEKENERFIGCHYIRTGYISCQQNHFRLPP